MNKNFYMKKCIVLIMSILCYTNFSFAQGSERGIQPNRGEGNTRPIPEEKVIFKSDARPSERPMPANPLPNPKGGNPKFLIAPVNDDCANAISLNVGASCSSIPGDDAGATQSIPASSCSGWISSSAMDVWYKFVAAAPDQTILLTESASFDAVIELRDGCNGNSITCSDQTSGGGHIEKIIATNLLPGTTYYIRVYFYGSSFPLTTTFDICVYTTPPPPPLPTNDECAGAISINPASSEAACVSTAVNTASSTQSLPNPACAGFSNDDDVWYKFVAPSTHIVVKAENLSGGASGVGFVMYDNSCAGTESIECTTQALNNRFDFMNLTVGHTYYLRTFTTGAGSGTFDLCVFMPPPPPANDECANAIYIATAANEAACASVNVNTVSATHSYPDPTCAVTSNDDDVWYKFVATDSSMTAKASNLGVGVYGIGFVLYADSCNGIQSIECTTYATNNKQLFAKLKIGKTYYLRTFVGGTGGGSYDICIYRTPPPANDDCINATSIVASGSSCNSIKGNVEGAYQSMPPNLCNGSSSFSAIDVWYKFVAVSANQTIQVAGSASFDPIVEVFDGCNGNMIACSNKNFSYGSIETLKDTGLTIGNTYYVRVYHNGSNPTTTDFDICIFKTPNPPANNDCSGAIKINPAPSAFVCQPTTVNTISATQSQPNPTCASFDNDDDVWYYFTANDTTMTVKSMNYSIGITAIGFVLYSDSCGGTQSTECSYYATSQTFNKLIKGHTYYLRTFTYSNYATGTYDICIIPGLPIAKNDNCVNAISIPVNNTCVPSVGDVLGATQSLPPINCGTGFSSAANDVWLSFVADANNATVEVKGSSNFDAIIEVFDACGGNSIGCSDNTYSGGTEKVTTQSLIVGNTYFVRVYSYGSGIPMTSTFNICVTSQNAVGISKIITDKILTVYPNPTQNDLNILFKSPSENAVSIRLYNSAGQLVYSSSNGPFNIELNKHISVEGFSKGFYLLQIVTESGVYNQKVSIN